MPSPSDKVGKSIVFGLSVHLVHSFVCSSGHILYRDYLVNAYKSFDKTDKVYSLTPTNDLIRFWRSKVKVTVGCRGSKGIHIDGEMSKFSFWLLSSAEQMHHLNGHHLPGEPRLDSCCFDFPSAVFLYLCIFSS